MIRFLFGRGKPKPRSAPVSVPPPETDWQPKPVGFEGYMWGARDHDDPVWRGSRGEVLRNPTRGPPWLIVHHDLERALVARWPGRLWRARIVDPVTASDHHAHGSSPPLHYAGYTRVVAAELLEELPAHALFGAGGEVISEILAVVDTLDEDSAAALARARHQLAGEAHGRAIRALGELAGWKMKEALSDADLDGVTYMGVGFSPLSGGLSLLHDQVSRRAQAVGGDAVLEPDPYDPEGAFLIEPWAGASLVLRDTALAFARPDAIDRSDCEILRHGWRTVFSADPA